MMRVLEEIQGLLSQSRKAVQMNCLARYLSVSLSKAVLKEGEDFGECFKYSPVYFGINFGNKSQACKSRGFYLEISRSILTTTICLWNLEITKIA